MNNEHLWDEEIGAPASVSLCCSNRCRSNCMNSILTDAERDSCCGDFCTNWGGHDYVGATGARAFIRDIYKYLVDGGLVYTPMPPAGGPEPPGYPVLWAPDEWDRKTHQQMRMLAGWSLFTLWTGRAQDYLDRYEAKMAIRTGRVCPCGCGWVD